VREENKRRENGRKKGEEVVPGNSLNLSSRDTLDNKGAKFKKKFIIPSMTLAFFATLVFISFLVSKLIGYS